MELTALASERLIHILYIITMILGFLELEGSGNQNQRGKWTLLLSLGLESLDNMMKIAVS